MNKKKQKRKLKAVAEQVFAIENAGLPIQEASRKIEELVNDLTIEDMALIDEMVQDLFDKNLNS